MTTFKKGQRVMHRDNSMMRGEIVEPGDEKLTTYRVMWDGRDCPENVSSSFLLPVPFGMGTKVKAVAIGEVVGECGDVRFVTFPSSDAPCAFSVKQMEADGWKEVTDGPEEEWPQKDDTYWFIDTGFRCHSDHFAYDIVDAERKKFGNMFRTEAEAKAAAERVRKALKGL